MLELEDDRRDRWLCLGRMLARSFLCDDESDSVSEVSESDLAFFLLRGLCCPVSAFSKAARKQVRCYFI